VLSDKHKFRMKIWSLIRVDLTIKALLIGLLTASHAVAVQLEEVVVTAQKREQSLRDVPIAISAVSGEQLRSSGQYTLDELSISIPNFTFSEAASGSDNIFIRGVGSGINYGFEQAVGQVIDGFFYGRSRFGRGAFLDLERVEVLKGPQGALLGKNTTAGAINLTTAKPTDEFMLRAQATYFAEGSEGALFDGAVSGPLTDQVKGRLSLRYEDRDGFVENVVSGQEEQSTEQLDIRGTIAVDLSDSFSATLMYQYGDADRTGRVGQLSKCGDPLKSFDPDGPGPAPAGALYMQMIALGEDCTANFQHTVVNQREGPVPQRFDTEYQIAGLTMVWNWQDFELTSLTGFSDYEFLDDFDADWTPITLAGAETTEEYSQWSQEFRISGGIGGDFEYLAGIYFLETEQDTDFRRDFVALPPPLTPSGNLIVTSQEAETQAVFGQLTWQFVEGLQLVLGGRYTHEKKDVIQSQTPTLLFTNEPVALIPPAGPGAGSHFLKGSRSESDFSPSGALQWYPNSQTMLYGKVAKGFKGGGYDFQNDGPQLLAEQKFEFDREDVLSYELGAKLSLFDGAAELNIAAFLSEFEDLQVSTLGENITFKVGNAAEATTKGVELDFRWALGEGLIFSGAVAHLDASYDSFPDAPCSAATILNQTCAGSADLTGEVLPFSPELTAVFRAEYERPINSSLSFFAMVSVSYLDEFALVLDLDRDLYQESFSKIDARIALGAPHGGWQIAVLGRNLTDETTRNFGNDALGGPFMLGTTFSHVEAPRTIAIQASLEF
jgi:iron complex outermembrane receptor protein